MHSAANLNGSQEISLRSSCVLQGRDYISKEDLQTAINLVILPRALIKDQNQDQQDDQQQPPPPPPPPPPPQDQQEDQEEEEQEEEEEEDEEDDQQDDEVNYTTESLHIAWAH